MTAPDRKVIVGLLAATLIVVAVAAVGIVLTLRADSTVMHIATDAQQASAPIGRPASVRPSHDEGAAQAAGLGEEVRDGNFSFVVAGVQRAQAIVDPQFPNLTKAAAGEYLIVKMTVTNVGRAPQTFFASFDTLTDGTTTFRSDDEAWIYLGNTLAELNPGDTVRTDVVFDVPDGTRPESIELHGGPMSDGVTVVL